MQLETKIYMIIYKVSLSYNLVQHVVKMSKDNVYKSIYDI